jgi:hypothetical protein
LAASAALTLYTAQNAGLVKAAAGKASQAEPLQVRRAVLDIRGADRCWIFRRLLLYFILDENIEKLSPERIEERIKADKRFQNSTISKFSI